jgi:hypothetical protein
MQGRLTSYLNPTWDKYSAFRAYESPVCALVPMDRLVWSMSESIIKGHQRGGLQVCLSWVDAVDLASQVFEMPATPSMGQLRCASSVSQSAFVVGGTAAVVRIDAERCTATDTCDFASTTTTTTTTTASSTTTSSNSTSSTAAAPAVIAHQTVVLRRGGRGLFAARSDGRVALIDTRTWKACMRACVCVL